MKRITALLVLAAGTLCAQSTINPTQRFAWAANAGWVSLRPSAADGVVVGNYVCSGYAYGANFGWMRLGSGTPQNHIRYTNTDSADYGVNMMPGGLLRGLAWGANIGWVNFEPVGNPHINLTTGALSGYAYSANIGWINLGDLTLQLTTDTLQPGADTNGNQIPDAWEYQRTGGLTQLSGTGDFDGDGISDLAEYLADTDPLSPADVFTIMQSQFATQLNGDIQFTLTWPSSPDRLYAIEYRDDLALGTWADSGLGTFAVNAGSTATRTLTSPPADRKFYRVRVLLPLQP